jgi:hypothetical protein
MHCLYGEVLKSLQEIIDLYPEHNCKLETQKTLNTIYGLVLILKITQFSAFFRQIQAEIA